LESNSHVTKKYGKDLSPFLNRGITWAIFQSDGNTFSRKNLLNKLQNGFDIVNSQMYSKTIHMLLKNDRSTNELPPLHDPFNNFNLAYDATQKSNVFNKYFCSITKLNDDDEDFFLAVSVFILTKYLP
jgi:hypothetical protein